MLRNDCTHVNDVGKVMSARVEILFLSRRSVLQRSKIEFVSLNVSFKKGMSKVWGGANVKDDGN